MTPPHACSAELPGLATKMGDLLVRLSALRVSHESIARGSHVSPFENLTTTGMSTVLTLVIGSDWATNGFLPTIV